MIDAWTWPWVDLTKGPYRWLCGLCRESPHHGVSAHGFASPAQAESAARRHKTIRHPKRDLAFLIVKTTEKSRLHPTPPGPYAGHCGVCQRIVVGPYGSFNDADDYVEAHRWAQHPDIPSVELSVAAIS